MDILIYVNCFLDALGCEYDDIKTKWSKTIIINQLFSGAYHNRPIEYIIENKVFSLKYVYDLCNVLDKCIYKFLDNPIIYKRELVKIPYFIQNHQNIIKRDTDKVDDDESTIKRINEDLKKIDDNFNAVNVSWEELNAIHGYRNFVFTIYKTCDYSEDSYYTYYMSNVLIKYIRNEMIHINKNQKEILVDFQDMFDSAANSITLSIINNILLEKYEKNKNLEDDFRDILTKYRNLIDKLV